MRARGKSAGVPAFREAAVTLAIFADPPHHVIFVERAAHLRDHPGQIGLPGGGVDPADGDDRARTALRELEEELGIPPERVRIVGRLPQIDQRVNNFSVAPFVGIVRPHTRIAIDESETAAVFFVPLAAIVAPGAVRDGIEVFGELEIPTDVFDYGDRHVWGLTGRILRTFVAAWNDGASGLRAAIEAGLEG
jgi:8-oxo-dGTP pyrophosphatase MutT (NUDIX family)